MVLLLLPAGSHAQDVIKASGGTNLSIDSVATQGFTTIDGPTIRETASGQLEQGQDIVLTLPDGFVWNDNLTSGDITITIEPTGANKTDLEVSFTDIANNAKEAIFTVDTESHTAGKGKGPGRVDIQGLELRPDTLDVPYEKQISNTGSTGPDVNYGNLSTAVGAIQEVQVETAADGSGQILQAQDLLAGESITVYSIGRDAGDNFVKNVALSAESDWTLTDGNGQVPQSALTASADLKSAEFSSQTTGTTKIEATLSGATSVTSELITVLPRPTDEIVINTQPSSSATAGSAFSTQPVIFLRDQFGNKVTTDDTTQVTASINTGDGSLSGTLTQTASSGEVTFTDLLSTTADTITLKFESPGLSTVTSDQIIINPAAASDLEYIQQPTNTAQNNTINPPVELQLLDQYGNNVQASGTTVSINSETFLKNNSTLSSDTENGIATFNTLNIKNSASTGSVNLTAQFSGISSPVTSNSFLITSSDGLAQYEITNNNGNDIGEQQAGTSFSITITAKQGDGDDFTFSSDSTLTITADNTIQGANGGTDVTILSGNSSVDTSLTLTSTGTGKIYADSSESISGQSNSFNVTPSGTIDPALSTISADPTEIIADGSSTSTITVQLKDEFGNNLVTGGETVELSTTAGTLNNTTASDEGNGTYTSVLTSSTDATEAATVTGTVNGNSISDDATVDFVPGEVVGFQFAIPSGDQTAGVAFNIDVDAIDNQNNIVTSFDGPVTFTTNSTISSGSSASFTNGELNNHSITLTKADSNATITATADNLFDVSSTSSSFIVLPNSPDADQSQLTAIPSTIQNDGSSQSIISVILRDAFQNRIFQQKDVSLSLEQLEENNSSSSGSPDASLSNGSNIPFNSSNGVYRDTLTSNNTIELVKITGSFGSSSTQITQTDTVDIVVPNTWQGDAGGPSNVQTDWTNSENWSQGSVPTSSDFVIIPNVQNLPVLDLNIDIGSFEIQSGVSLTLFGGNTINVSGNIILNGSLDIEDNTEVTTGSNFNGSGSFTAGDNTTINIAGDVNLGDFLARTTGTQINLNGESPQFISTPIFLAQNLNIKNDVTADSNADLIDTDTLTINANNAFELNQGATDTLDVFSSITGGGTLIINDNTLVLGGDTDVQDIDVSQATVIFGVRLGQDPANFNLSQQLVSNLDQMKNAIINNDQGVKTTEDIIVDGSLTLENGELIITSGKSLIAPNQTYNNGSLSIRRNISQQGWHMLSAPINTDFADLFDELIVQGMTNSTYPDRQPNLLYYNETIEGTDNQRWRTPDDLNNTIQDPDSTGRGFFFYVFGDVENDSDYNDILPVTLTVNGEEYQHQNNSFNFSSVTYTAAADTGWNLVGNPWASTIDWDNENWTKTNIDETIYIWDPSTNDYLTWNGIDGSLGNGLIKSFQAFWVKANDQNPTLSIDKSAKTTGGEFYSKTDKKPASIEFLLEADSLSKETHLTLTPNGSNGKDRRDAFRLLTFETETYLELFTTLDDGTQLAINNLARSFGKEISIPLHVGGFVDGQPLNGEYILSWPEFGDVPDAWSLVLEDKKTGETIDLRKNTFYSFNLSQSKQKKVVKNTMENFRLTAKPQGQTKGNGGTNASNRFVLNIDPGADGSDVPDEYSLGKNYPNPFSDQTTIEYNTPVEGEVKLMIYDILGRRVKTILDERRPAAYHEIDWSPNQLASGVYIVVMRAGGKQLTKKLTYIK